MDTDAPGIVMPGVARCVVQPEAPEGWRAVLDAAGLALGVPLEPAPAVVAQVRAALQGDGSGHRLAFATAGGATAWAELRVGATVDGRLECLLLDVTERQRTEEVHAAAARAADLVADEAGFILYTNEYLANRTHRPVYRSRDFSHLLGGLEEGQDTDGAWEAAVHPDDRADLLAFRERLFGGVSARVEFRLRQRDRSWRWVEARVTARTDEAGRRLGDGVLIDITARKASEQALEDALRELDRRSRVDSLTGLYNRAHGSEVVRIELERARGAHDVGALMLDIDHFKAVNDEYGHAVGDAVLRGVGQRVGRALRSFDCAARWGGEEFCAVLPGVGTDERLCAIGERLRAAVSGTPIETSIGPITVTVSVGGASTADGLDDADALVDAADQALYAAKRRGRDQVRTFATLSQRDREEAAPRIVRLAEVLALTASVREGMPPLHCRQVSELAAAVAVALELPRHVAVRCQVAGWLHDVGKVAIPDTLLRKTGPLDPEEVATMRAHAVIGDQLVRQVQELADAAPGVRHHHERWDGTGYPDGLAGDAIPIEARIVAAVDAYSAMTIERVYRRPMERHEAIAELKRSAGTHLDPSVVKALVGVLERDVGELERAA